MADFKKIQIVTDLKDIRFRTEINHDSYQPLNFLLGNTSVFTPSGSEI